MTIAAAAGVLHLVKGPDPLAGYGAEGYQCQYNAYNCSDFRTRAEAQAVYQACGGLRNDVHHLDRDRRQGLRVVALSAFSKRTRKSSGNFCSLRRPG
jgi:hypothetical protein